VRILSLLTAASSGLLALSLASTLSCSSESGEGEAAAGKGGSGLDLNASGGGGSGTAGGRAISADGCSLVTDGSECAGQAYEGEAVPLDIYIMFDQSGSMLNDVGGLTRLDAIERAAQTFLRDEASAKLRVGLGFFGAQPIGSTSCDPAMYATPAVGITSERELLVDELSAREPIGETPTGAAIEGACGYAKQWKRDNPGHAVVLLLLTDGEPKAPVTCSGGACCPTLEDAVTAAAACREGAQSIPTYVLGVGPFLDNLQKIAEAGGTKRAYLVGDEEVEQNVLAALSKIRGEASIPCQLRLPAAPPGAALDAQKVNVAYQDPSCELTTMYYVSEPAECDSQSGGWYYDDPSAPDSIRLCDASCDRVSVAGGRLALTVGCATKTQVK
jgi:Mg-chelatase subunit ChlD